MNTLIFGYLERISSAVFDLYLDEITELVRKQHGVYALYKKERLYYVGLAKDLKGRVKYHLKDRHAKKWDSFSLYLIRNTEHLKELESLVIHIAEPKGNVQRGKFQRSQNLLKALKGMMEDRDKRQREKILVGSKRKKNKKSISQKTTSISQSRSSVFAGMLPAGAQIKAMYKKQEYFATVDDSGKIILKNKRYNSPSQAAQSILTSGAVNGWLFWKYQNKKGEWVRIDALRKRKVNG